MASSSPDLPLSVSAQLELGLRWLAAAQPPATLRAGDSGWPQFLARAQQLPAVKGWLLLRLWPLLALFNGALVLSGLLVWPQGSGIHLLLFLLLFWLLPLITLLWTVVRGLLLGRCPWWQPLLTSCRDPLMACWCARQSLRATLCYCLAGLCCLWLMLSTREVIFYWSTSIGAVSASVEGFFQALGLGLLASPPVASAEAGAITGWQGATLMDSQRWGLWLSQVLALWLLLPMALLLLLCQVLLRRRLARWPDYNSRLRLLYQQYSMPHLHYQALEGEESPPQYSDAAAALQPLPVEPGFIWQAALPQQPTSPSLGEGAFEHDQQQVAARGSELQYWYIAAHTVPTGDLADLIAQHTDMGVAPTLCVIVAPGQALGPLNQSWRGFLQRHQLPVQLQLCAPESTP